MLPNVVSVILPVYNGASFVCRAIETALLQTYSHVEIIAVDDGSTDSSFEILARYGDRVQVIRQQNAGVAAARNSAISASRGEFVAFLDQDDWWLPEKIEQQV